MPQRRNCSQLVQFLRDLHYVVGGCTSWSTVLLPLNFIVGEQTKKKVREKTRTPERGEEWRLIWKFGKERRLQRLGTKFSQCIPNHVMHYFNYISSLPIPVLAFRCIWTYFVVIKTFVDATKQLIALKYNSSVWKFCNILYQLDQNMESKVPVHILSCSDFQKNH